MWRSLLLLMWVCLCSAGALGQAVPSTQAAGPSTVPTDQPIPRQALLAMDRAELGALFDPAKQEAIYHAHELLERYFAVSDSDQRRRIVGELGKTGLTAGALAKIVRIRMNWPALAEGIYYLNDRIGPHPVHYFLGVPAGYDRTRAGGWPLVIKLPTADAFVTKPPPSANQVVAIYSGWMREELAAHPDALVLMPLLNLDELYGPSYAGMNSVMYALRHVYEKVNLDPRRVYLMGHSMAAHAVWNLALHYPTYFAAVMPLAGSASEGYQRLRLVNLRNTLPVVWHDASDRVIKANASRQLVRVLREKKINVEYEETKTAGHVPPAEVVTELYARMRARVRELYPREVTLQSNRPDTIFNRVDWVQIYQPLNPGKERRVWFSKGASRMILNENSWGIDAVYNPQRIDANTQNVETVRFYLSGDMMDLSRPITINVNKKTRFEGLVQPSIDEMLKDQVFLGRGWRGFTAVVDIDLTGAASAATSPTTRTTTSQPRPRGTIEIIPPGGGEPRIYHPKK